MAEISDIPVTDNFEPVPGVDYGDDPQVETPVTPEVTPAPEPTEPAKVEPEKTVEPATTEPEKQIPVERSKPKPIATLLEKKHELETSLEAERAEKAELQRKLDALSNQPQSPQSDDDIKALADEYGLDETLVAKIINTARKGVNPELPKEIQDLIAERNSEKQQQEELKAFEADLKSLTKTFDSEPIDSVKEKLLELAYSTELAPDGEPYFKKPLHELYFKFIKPEIEPGQVSAESSQGGTKSSTVIDFEEIYTKDDPKDIENMDSDTFKKYETWIRENKESKTPIKRG